MPQESDKINDPAIATELMARVVVDEIIEIYDHLESLLNRISVQGSAKIHAELAEAKAHVWEARMEAEGHRA